MIERNDLYHRLLFLRPGSKFSFWADDGRELNYQDNKVDYIKIDGWCVGWLKINNSVCPSFDDLNTVSQLDIDNKIKKDRKDARNSRYSDDLTIISNYSVEKKDDPGLTFSDYLDKLEDLIK